MGQLMRALGQHRFPVSPLLLAPGRVFFPVAGHQAAVGPNLVQRPGQVEFADLALDFRGVFVGAGQLGNVDLAGEKAGVDAADFYEFSCSSYLRIFIFSGPLHTLSALCHFPISPPAHYRAACGPGAARWPIAHPPVFYLAVQFVS